MRSSHFFAKVRVCRAFWLVGVFLSACSIGPGNIQIRQSTDLEARKIRRIAVLSPEPDTRQKALLPFTSTGSESKTPERGAPELLARQLYSTMAALPGWQIVSEHEVQEVAQTIGHLSDSARLRRLGELVYADAVLRARVIRYRERIGNEAGAKSPASVAFVVELVDVRRGDVVWSARFDETQKALSENLFAIGDISQRGIRWLTADQLMLAGVRKAVNQLHRALVRSPG